MSYTSTWLDYANRLSQINSNYMNYVNSRTSSSSGSRSSYYSSSGGGSIFDNDPLADAPADATTNNATTNNTATNNATPTTTSSAQTYTGGNKTISDYSGEKITFSTSYTGVDFGDNTFHFHSPSGTLTIGNVRDKVVDFRDSAGNVLAKAYAANASGKIDGRGYAGYQFIVGVNGGANEIYAGSSGSTLWGNSGNTSDVLTGGDGNDTFYVGKNDGNDTINNASESDNVNLYDVSLSEIVRATESNGTFDIGLSNGNTIKVQGNDNLSSKFTLGDGSSWRFNRTTRAWQGA